MSGWPNGSTSRSRRLANESVHADTRVQLQDARLIVGVLPHLFLRTAPALLRVVALVQACLRVPSAEEDDSLGPPPRGGAHRPDVARERVLLQIEEELLERIRTAPRCPDEFSLWQEEVLGRKVPSVVAAHSPGPSKKVPT